MNKKTQEVFDVFRKDLELLFDGQGKAIHDEILSLAKEYPQHIVPFLPYQLALYELKNGEVEKAREYFMKAIRAFAVFNIKGDHVTVLPFYVGELLPIETQFKQILNSGSLSLIESNLRSLQSSLNKQPWIKEFTCNELSLKDPFIGTEQKQRNKTYFHHAEPYIGMTIRIKSIYFLGDLLSFKTIDFSVFDLWGKILRNIGFINEKENLDSLETFAMSFERLISVQNYKSLGQLTDDEEQTLLRKLIPDSVHSISKANLILDKQGRESLRQDILSIVRGELSLVLTKTRPGKKALRLMHDTVDYELISSGKKKKLLTFHQAEKIRNRKGTGSKNEIFIDDERKEVFFHKELLKDFRHQHYAMLLYFVENDGIGGDFLRIYNNLWEAQVAEDKVKGAVETAVSRFRIKVENNGMGSVPWNSKNSYSISKTYIMKPKPKYCILRKIEKEKKEESANPV